MKKKITIIDLHNFSYYPTLSVGYLIANLRESEFEVNLLSPLMSGVGARKRERIENITHYWKALLMNSDRPAVNRLMATAKKTPFIYNRWLKKEKVFDILKPQIDVTSDVILVSTYFENFYVCQEMAEYLKEFNVPMIIGGPGFNNTAVTEEWLKLDGVKAVVGAEIDGFLANMVRDFLDDKDISAYPGVFMKEKAIKPVEHIYTAMDELPVPDFTDFPWERYPMRIIPYMTARGCGWGKCNFCTDVTYVNGRTYRSMSKEKVLEQLKHLSEVNDANIFYFSDLKLNSNLEVWNALIEEFPKIVDSPKWFATVHVDNKRNNGLDRDTLLKAKAAGLTRISFGFETASQRMLDHMKKGTRVANLQSFLDNAHEAGISVRATMFVGYPYETEEDLKETYEFLVKNEHCFDRIGLAKFQLFEMAPIYAEAHEEFENKKIQNPKYNHRINMQVKRGPKYRHYKHKVMRQVNKINSRPITKEAVAYDGVM